jgi:hypothetical protein
VGWARCRAERWLSVVGPRAGEACIAVTERGARRGGPAADGGEVAGRVPLLCARPLLLPLPLRSGGPPLLIYRGQGPPSPRRAGVALPARSACTLEIPGGQAGQSFISIISIDDAHKRPRTPAPREQRNDPPAPPPRQLTSGRCRAARCAPILKRAHQAAPHAAPRAGELPGGTPGCPREPTAAALAARAALRARRAAQIAPAGGPRARGRPPGQARGAAGPPGPPPAAAALRAFFRGRRLPPPRHHCPPRQTQIGASSRPPSHLPKSPSRERHKTPRSGGPAPQ